MRIIPVQNTIFRHLTQDGRGHTPATVKDQDPKIRSCRVSNTHIFFVFISCFKGPSRNQKQETLLFFYQRDVIGNPLTAQCVLIHCTVKGQTYFG